MAKKVIFITETFNHMGGHSGASVMLNSCSRFFENYEIWRYQDFQKTRFILIDKFKIFFGGISASFFGYQTQIHNRISSKIIRKIRKNPHHIFVLLEGENQFTEALFNLNKAYKYRLIVFTHQPVSWYKLKGVSSSIYSDLGALFVFGEREREFFENANFTKVKKTIHGVDASFFQTDNGILRSENEILFVGGWLRDFKLLYEAFELAYNKNSKLLLHCVIPLKYRQNDYVFQLAKMENVIFYHNLTDKELLQLYQKVSLVLLPLLDVTANNVMGESIACGTPILCNDIYVCSWYKHNVWDGVFVSENNAVSYGARIVELIHENKQRKAIQKPNLEKISWDVALTDLKNAIELI